MTPQRIQRKRTKGWKKPPNTVNATRPSKYSNPYKVGIDYPTAEECIEHFKKSLLETYSIEEIKADLAGKNIMCYCGLDKPCHVDFLLTVANQ